MFVAYSLYLADGREFATLGGLDASRNLLGEALLPFKRATVFKRL